jgi:hypothetical protein
MAEGVRFELTIRQQASCTSIFLRNGRVKTSLNISGRYAI